MEEKKNYYLINIISRIGKILMLILFFTILTSVLCVSLGEINSIGYIFIFTGLYIIFGVMLWVILTTIEFIAMFIKESSHRKLVKKKR